MLVQKLLPIARTKLVTLGDGAPVLDAAKLLGRKDANLVVVCDAQGTLVGVIAKTDIVREVGSCAGNSCTMAASAVMTREVACCGPDDSLKDVWAIMKSRGLKHIPVIDNQRRPLGLATARDVLDALLDEVEYEEQLLIDYVKCIGYH